MEKEMATHSSILTWRILWTEESGGLDSMVSQSQTWLSDKHFHTFTFTAWACILDLSAETFLQLKVKTGEQWRAMSRLENTTFLPSFTRAGPLPLHFELPPSALSPFKPEANCSPIFCSAVPSVSVCTWKYMYVIFVFATSVFLCGGGSDYTLRHCDPGKACSALLPFPLEDTKIKGNTGDSRAVA